MSWPLKHLDQLGHVSRGRSRHRPRDAAHLYGGQFPFIQTGDVKHAGLYITKYQQTYSEAGLAQSKLWPAGTLCITIAANIADTAILGIDACFPDSVIGFIPDPDEADARFVKYLFDATLQRRVKRFTQGAAQDNLSQEKLLSLEFHVPKVDEQRRIASILSTYDNLIENNNRRIELLEESARLLYRDWFVFLRYPGHELVNVVDGVPEGWERENLGSKIVLNYGKALKAENRIEGTFPVYGSSGVVGTHEKALIKGPGIIVGRKGNVGSVFWSVGDFYPIDTVYYIDLESSSFYLYHALQNMQFVSNDAAVPGLNREFAYSRLYLEPAPKIAKLFEETVTPIYEQTFKLKAYNNKLKQARDLLLPRLMSGELCV